MRQWFARVRKYLDEVFCPIVDFSATQKEVLINFIKKRKEEAEGFIIFLEAHDVIGGCWLYLWFVWLAVCFVFLDVCTFVYLLAIFKLIYQLLWLFAFIVITSVYPTILFHIYLLSVSQSLSPFKLLIILQISNLENALPKP